MDNIENERQTITESNDLTAAFSVPTEFIEENSAFCQSIKNYREKGGPHTKKERFERRQQVYRLHFEQGYSGLKICEMIHANRNTINADINYWYSQLSKDWQIYDVKAWMVKQTNRMELQRFRLVKELEKTQNLRDRLVIEKMIFEIDREMMQIAIKTSTSYESMLDLAVYSLNCWTKENKLNISFIHSRDITKVTPKTHEKIDKLLNEDRKRMVQ